MGTLAVGLAMLALGVPVAVAIGICAILALAISGTPILVVPQQFFANLNKFELLAIPFFMLTGAVMDTGGISRRLIDFAQALVGFVRGGLGMVTVVASLFFADISGSATADTAAIGSVMIPGMVARGYAAPFATALQSASGSLGLLFPPSMCSIMYAYVANVSVGKMFIASFLPGLLVAVSFMVVNYITAIRRNYSAVQEFSLRTIWKSFKNAAFALIAPVIILGGILGGLFTPTESGVIAACYVIFISKFVYKELTFANFRTILIKTVINTTRVSFLLGLAFVLGAFLIRERVAHQVASSLLQMTSNKLLLLVLINIFLLVVHTMLETISSIIVVLPVILPVITSMGMDPVAFGIIVLVNSAIGINMPPIGFCLYTASSISNVPLEQAFRAILPFIFTLLIDLTIVILFPQISLALPKLFHM